MEIQVLSAILPISQIPSIPSCMHFVLRHISLERILLLEHPDPLKREGKVDKRTWRGERPSRANTAGGGGEGTNGEEEKKEQSWTTMDVLTGYALKNGWVTAKAGRPDVNRAGNARESPFHSFSVFPSGLIGCSFACAYGSED
jgi:hypothetical protein